MGTVYFKKPIWRNVKILAGGLWAPPSNCRGVSPCILKGH